MIDVIIPVLNEEDFLRREAEYYSELKNKANIIFVDGGSWDKTVDLAENYGEVIHSRRGRSFQKNIGAKAAKSDYLLFLHVDSLINMKALENIERVLSCGVYGGCLTMVIDDTAFIFRIFERIVNLRARFGKVLDGDLGQFVHRDIFLQLGRYAQVDIMEDILFGKKLKRKGNIEILPDVIRVSSRKWSKEGFCSLLYKYSVAYVRLWTGRLKYERTENGPSLKGTR